MRILLLLSIMPLLLITFGCGLDSPSDIAALPHLLDTGQWDRAEKIIDEIAAADSLDPRARYGRGVLAEYRGLKWDALLTHIEVAPSGGGFLPAIKDFVRLSIDLDYLKNGRIMADIMVRSFPDDLESHLLMAQLGMREDRLDLAAAAINRADSLTEDKTLIGLYRAEIDLHTYDQNKITAALRSLSEMDYSTVTHYRRLADIYNFMNMGDSTLLYCRKAAESDNSNLRLKIELAQTLFDNLHLYEALKLVNEVLEESKEYGQAQVLAAYIKRSLNRPADAERNFMEFLGANRTSPIPLEMHADYYDYFDEPRRAVTEYQSAFLTAENRQYADDYILPLFFKMEYSLLDNFDPPGAKNFLDKYEQIAPNLYDMFFLKANVMLAWPEMQDSARGLVKKNIAEHLDDRRWLELAAHHFYRVNRPDQSVDLYKKLLGFPRPRHDYYTGLLQIYKERGNVEGTDWLAGNIPLRFQGNRIINEYFRDIYLDAGQTGKAIVYARRLYDYSPGYLPNITILSDLFTAQNMPDSAEIQLKTFIAAYPDVAEGHYRMARIALDKGRTDDFIASINRSLALDRNFGSAFELKGLFFLDDGRTDSAMYYFRKTVMMNWRTPLAYYHLGEYLLQKGDSLDRAAGLGMAAVRLFENKDSRGYDLLGRVYMAQKKYNLAQKEYFKGTMNFPDNAGMFFNLGTCHYYLENRVKAGQALKMALELGLTPQQKEKARQMLKEL